MQIPLDSLIPGATLCDMHYGLSCLETRLPGFQLLHHSRIETDTALTIVQGLFPGMTIHNKLLYYFDQESSGHHKAVYCYDGRYFGIVTFTA